jgi:hypothetical protein
VTTQVGLTIGKSRSWTGRNCILCCTSSTATATTASTLAALARRCCAAARSATTSCTDGRAALLARWGLNGNNHLHKYEDGKTRCQSND